MKKYYHVIAKDGKPFERGDGRPEIFTRGKAILEAKKYGGKLQEVSEEISLELELSEALIELKNSFLRVLDLCAWEKEFNPETYPFNASFLEITDDVIAWVESETIGMNHININWENDPEYEAKMLLLKSIGMKPLKRPLKYYCPETRNYYSEEYIRETPLKVLRCHIDRAKKYVRKGGCSDET